MVTSLQKLFPNPEYYVPFTPGQIVFSEGHAGDVMYVIGEGQVEIVVGNQVIETLGRGEILGEMALIDTKPRSATAVAKTTCKLAPINRKRFNFLVQQTPSFALDVMQIMAARLRRMDSLIQ